MVNGKPGDHPLTDILVHGLTVYGPRADLLIKEVLDLGGEREMEDHFDLLHLDPRLNQAVTPDDLARFEQQLENLRDRLYTDAVSRGWEV
jgi:hypothetical protein